MENEEKNNEQKPLTWGEIQSYVGKPVYDMRKKMWRVVEGYKSVKDSYEITFTDSVIFGSVLKEWNYILEKFKVQILK